MDISQISFDILIKQRGDSQMTNEISTTGIKRQELLIEQSKYHILVENELRSLSFDTSIYKKFANIVLFNILLGALFCWGSAGESSNIYQFPQLGAIIFVTLNILYFVWIFTVIKSAQNISKSINMKFLSCSSTLRDKFISFIKPLFEEKYNIKFSNFKENMGCYKSEQEYTVTFLQSKFETYIESIMKSYALNTSYSFSINYARFILISLCLESMIEQTRGGIDVEYTVTLNEQPFLLAKLL